MNHKTDNIRKPKNNQNYYNTIPENRDFFFLDSAEKIKDFKTTNFEDPEYICVVSENKENMIKENIYVRKDFLIDYEFIKVTDNKSKIELNFIISKARINIGGRETRIITEIKARPSIMKEIFRRTKINFLNNDYVYLKENFTVPTELKFYNRIFTLHFEKLSSINIANIQNQQNNNVFNNYNNNGFNNNTNNNICGNGNYNKDNNIGINQNQTFNNINTPGFNNANINIINNNLNIQNFKNNPNNINTNNLNSQAYQFIYNNNFNNINSRNDYNAYIYNSKNNTDVHQIRSNPNQPNNQQGNLNNINIAQNNYQNNNSQNKNGNEDIEMKDETEKNKGKFNTQSGTNNNQPGAYPPQTGVNSQQGANPPQGTLPNQPGTNNSQSGSNNSQQQQIRPNEPNSNSNYLFSKKGLKNIGSTCYMNATLQCLLHVNELINYFIEEYPKDQQKLAKINSDVVSRGDISRAFFNLVIGVNENSELVMSKKNLKPKTKKKSGFNFFGIFDNDYDDDSSYDRAFAPTEFKRTLGLHNPQFKKFEANDSKDLILYLLQTMHEELNYLGNINKRLKYIPNQYNIYETYQHFITNYNTNNFSKISLLFYGTYKNTTTCLVCNKKIYNFQKFEFISFGMYYYHKKKFNILYGFQDNANPTVLKGDNKFLCNNCKKLQDAKTECQIFEPPIKLLINLDYGKNKKYQPSTVEFDEEIDITKFVDFDYKQKIRYRIIGVCTHYGHSGSYGHYVAFCRNTQTDTWYEFNDSFCSECNKREIYRGSPYLLLYERIFN